MMVRPFWCINGSPPLTITRYLREIHLFHIPFYDYVCALKDHAISLYKQINIGLTMYGALISCWSWFLVKQENERLPMAFNFMAFGLVFLRRLASRSEGAHARLNDSNR